jgi:hypothetical protein
LTAVKIREKTKLAQSVLQSYKRSGALHPSWAGELAGLRPSPEARGRNESGPDLLKRTVNLHEKRGYRLL